MEIGLFDEKVAEKATGMKAFDEVKVRLLIPEPAHWHQKQLEAGTIVKAMLVPSGQIYLLLPDKEIPTAFRTGVKEGVDFERV